MKKSYGNIKTNNLKSILGQRDLQELWTINKDEIKICKDCEYRYCCTDCRVFTDDVNDKYSRPSSCTYNPYQGLWKGDEGYIDVSNWLGTNNSEDNA